MTHFSTTSIQDPRDDFETNALGTFNVLEAVRHSKTRLVVIYSPTNKVYGKLAGVRVKEGTARYEIVDLKNRVPESMPLEFFSPYGCSKGCGDQYVQDYSRIYGIKTIVFVNHAFLVTDNSASKTMDG